MNTGTPLPALQWLQARLQWVCWRREERKGKGSSDHAPVVVDLDR